MGCLLRRRENSSIWSNNWWGISKYNSVAIFIMCISVIYTLKSKNLIEYVVNWKTPEDLMNEGLLVFTWSLSDLNILLIISIFKQYTIKSVFKWCLILQVNNWKLLTFPLEEQLHVVLAGKTSMNCMWRVACRDQRRRKEKSIRWLGRFSG